jgi:hypothetical protein
VDCHCRVLCQPRPALPQNDAVPEDCKGEKNRGCLGSAHPPPSGLSGHRLGGGCESIKNQSIINQSEGQVGCGRRGQWTSEPPLYHTLPSACDSLHTAYRRVQVQAASYCIILGRLMRTCINFEVICSQLDELACPSSVTMQAIMHTGLAGFPQLPGTGTTNEPDEPGEPERFEIGGEDRHTRPLCRPDDAWMGMGQ